MVVRQPYILHFEWRLAWNPQFWCFWWWSGAPHLSHHPHRFLQYECWRQKYRRHIFVVMKFVWHASVISSENVGLFYGLFTFIYWKDLGISLAMSFSACGHNSVNPIYRRYHDSWLARQPRWWYKILLRSRTLSLCQGGTWYAVRSRRRRIFNHSYQRAAVSPKRETNDDTNDHVCLLQNKVLNKRSSA